MTAAVTVAQTPDGSTDLLDSEIRVTLSGDGQATRTHVRKVAQTDVWDSSVAGRIVEGAPYAGTILELGSLPYGEATRLLRQALISSAIQDRRRLQ